MSERAPGSRDLAHDVNRAKVEIRQELQDAKAEIRQEFREALRANSELLITAGVGRHEKAILRIEALEKTHAVFAESITAVPTQLDREASRLSVLFDEKLSKMALKINAVQEYAAAMRASAKELTASYNDSNAAAIEKSEKAITKEIDGLKTLLESKNKAFDTEIANLADRINRGEGALLGGRGVIGILVGGVGAIGVAVSIFVSAHPNPPPVSSTTVGENTKRVDDLGSRLDALSARINALTPPIPKKE